VIVVDVPAESFAWNGNAPVNGLIIVYVPVKPPVVDDLITDGVVTIFAPSLTVKWNVLLALNPEPVNDIVVPLAADAGVSVIAEAIWNDVDPLLIASVALTMYVCIPGSAGTLNDAVEKPPVELVVTVDGVVVRAAPLNLNVIAFDGAKWMPDTEIVAPM
jgi:hypothetical protein